eukprot:TRINITY_DN8566_c0_g1_i1.p1 TRINITY_DN8566_c0_g1~~TRINITY_DN8566_c0_g1_i1.p1  ORF type:complete len:248 (-),score=48.92 TRINITY_DN8566_c0_g1_i1:27-770(-)
MLLILFLFKINTKYYIVGASNPDIKRRRRRLSTGVQVLGTHEKHNKARDELIKKMKIYADGYKKKKGQVKKLTKENIRIREDLRFFKLETELSSTRKEKLYQSKIEAIKTEFHNERDKFFDFLLNIHHTIRTRNGRMDASVVKKDNDDSLLSSVNEDLVQLIDSDFNVIHDLEEKVFELDTVYNEVVNNFEVCKREYDVHILSLQKVVHLMQNNCSTEEPNQGLYERYKKKKQYNKKLADMVLKDCT